jgi:hypothetical protein
VTPNAPIPDSPHTNGHAARVPDRMFFDEVLKNDKPLTEGYRPTLPLWALEADWLPQLYLLRDIEIMMIHPIVRSVLNYFKAGLANAEFAGPPDPKDPTGDAYLPTSDSPEIDTFVLSQVRRYWDRGVPKVQGGYEYGWIGLENMYDEISPRDTYLLTKDRAPVGVRVKNVLPAGQVDLWLAGGEVPAKGLWYAHDPRFNAFYGQSQLLGAWRPFRRLASKDAAETVIDTAIYRFGFCGPQVGYPDEDMQVSPTAGAPATTVDSQGRPRRYARDVARQIAEWAKTGAGIGLPTTKYPVEQGGGDKWWLKWPEHVIDANPLIAYAKYLHEQISYGIGVPPELLAAADAGSGYSGRAIPMQAFMAWQQRIANAILCLFVDQVLRPLVRWNFGPTAKFEVCVKNLLKTHTRASGANQNPNSPPDNLRKPGPDEGAPQGQAFQGNAPQAPPSPPSMLTPDQGSFSIESASRLQEIARRILGRRAA